MERFDGFKEAWEQGSRQVNVSMTKEPRSLVQEWFSVWKLKIHTTFHIGWENWSKTLYFYIGYNFNLCKKKYCLHWLNFDI